MEFLKITRAAVLSGTPLLFLLSVDNINYLFSVNNKFFLMYWLFFPMLGWLILEKLHYLEPLETNPSNEKFKDNSFNKNIKAFNGIKIVFFTFIGILILYFTTSPYQNCQRELDNTRYCLNQTNW